jgi:hypothetical protein
MDHCRKIWFYTPAQEAGAVAGIVAIVAALLLIVFFC